MQRLKVGGERKEGDDGSRTSSTRKRRKNAERPKPPSGYLQEWVHQSRPFMTPAPHYEPQCNPVLGPYWELASSPRMYAAFSDPSVCRYSVPAVPPPHLAYSYEPVSLPLYQPSTYQATAPPGPGSTWRSPQHVPSRLKTKSDNSKCLRIPRSCRSGKRVANISGSIHHNSNSAFNQENLNHQNNISPEEYLSLPPGIQHACDLDDSQRRFSDPGLAHPESNSLVNKDHENVNDNEQGSEHGSEEWSESSAASPESAVLSMELDAAALTEQLSLLRADNKRLSRELRDTRAELHKLKLQATAWGNPVPQDYQPGMIADLVREVRDAAQLREETLLSRLRLMMADGGVLRLSGTNTLDKEGMNLFHQHRESNTSTPDAHSVHSSEDHKDPEERLARLERQLSELQLSQNGGSDVTVSRREDLLRRELQEAQTARKMAESNVNKLERLVNVLRKKVNGVSVDDGKPDVAEPPSTSTKTPDADAAPSSLDSLTSAWSSSLGSAHGTATMTPTGPVTDL